MTRGAELEDVNATSNDPVGDQQSFDRGRRWTMDKVLERLHLHRRQVDPNAAPIETLEMIIAEFEAMIGRNPCRSLSSPVPYASCRVCRDASAADGYDTCRLCENHPWRGGSGGTGGMVTGIVHAASTRLGEAIQRAHAFTYELPIVDAKTPARVESVGGAGDPTTPSERLAAWNSYNHRPDATEPWLHDGEVAGVGIVLACASCQRPVVVQDDGGPKNCYWCGEPKPFGDKLAKKVSR